MEALFILIGIGGIILCVAIIVLRVKNQVVDPIKNSVTSSKVKEYVKFDEKTATLTILERNPEIAKAVKIVNDKNISVGYEPEKLHYGSVSVGGVTTGGFYKTGGYNTFSSSGKSGYVYLDYLGHMIRYIQLDNQLYELAQGSSIAAYLNGSKQIQVVNPVSLSIDDVKGVFDSSGHLGAGANTVMQKSKQGYPSHQKCWEILHWICGENTGDYSSGVAQEYASKAKNIGIASLLLLPPLAFLAINYAKKSKKETGGVMCKDAKTGYTCGIVSLCLWFVGIIINLIILASTI